MEQRRATSPLGQACPKGDVASFVFALCCPIGSSLPLKGKTTGGQLPITIKFPLPFVSLPPPVRFAVPPEGVKDGATKGFTPSGGIPKGVKAGGKSGSSLWQPKRAMFIVNNYQKFFQVKASVFINPKIDTIYLFFIKM